MEMYTVCFDASGHEMDQDYVVVAGFISSADHWINFSKEWNERLEKDGLTFLHMKKFAFSKPPFDKLDKAGRQKLLADLLDIIISNVFRLFAVVVNTNHLRKHLSQTAKDQLFLNCYSYAGRTAVSVTSLYLRDQRMNHTPLEVVFEKGDLGVGWLEKRLRDDGYSPQFRFPTDRSLKGVTHAGFAPLQAADFAAYELFQIAKDEKISGAPGQRFMDMVSEIREIHPRKYRRD